MNYCKVCGKKLELTPEYDMCMECQGKQHRTFTLPYNGDSWKIVENYILKAQAQERELRELKATPTEQEVCEAYYKCCNTPLVYDKTLKQFTEIKGGRAQGRIIARLRYDNLDIPHILPPHLVEMIGKFYKEKVKE